MIRREPPVVQQGFATDEKTGLDPNSGDPYSPALVEIVLFPSSSFELRIEG